jgi:hypothetical protein
VHFYLLLIIRKAKEEQTVYIWVLVGFAIPKLFKFNNLKWLNVAYTLWKCLLLCTVLFYINDMVISNTIFKSWKELFSCVLVRCNNISFWKYLTCYQTWKLLARLSFQEPPYPLSGDRYEPGRENGGFLFSPISPPFSSVNSHIVSKFVDDSQA